MPTPAGRAAWTLTVRRRSVDADGTAHLSAELADRGAPAGELAVTITADRAVRLEWRPAPGAPELSDFQAWALPAREEQV